MPATPGDFDRYVTEHGIDLPEAFANWIAEQTGGPPPRFEKVDDDPSPDPDA